MSPKHVVFLCCIIYSCTYATSKIPIPKYTPALSGPYIEGDVGFAIIDWKYFDPQIFASDVATEERYLEGGFMGAADGGYQFNKSFAIEFGFAALPRVTMQGSFAPSTFPVSSESKGFFIYLGAKLQKQFAINNFVFLKLAPAYRFTEFRSQSLTTAVSSFDIRQKAYHFVPLLGIGVTHFFTPAFSINFQYMYLGAVVQHFEAFPGGNVSDINVPSANIFLIGLGYMYNGSYQEIDR